MRRTLMLAIAGLAFTVACSTSGGFENEDGFQPDPTVFSGPEPVVFGTPGDPDEVLTVVYDFNEYTMQIADFPGPRIGLPEYDPDPDVVWSDSDDMPADTDVEEENGMCIEEVMEWIIDNISPETWTETGGGTMEVVDSGHLRIRTTRRVHLEICASILGEE